MSIFKKSEIIRIIAINEAKKIAQSFGPMKYLEDSIEELVSSNKVNILLMDIFYKSCFNNFSPNTHPPAYLTVYLSALRPFNEK